jgi:Na+/melibiose symporter-like transporter
MTDPIDAPGGRLSLATLVAFALPSAHFMLVRLAAYGTVSALYAEHFGLDLAAISAVLLGMRVVEALLQIPAGYLADRLRHGRWGRKPLLFAGMTLSAVAIFQVYVPPDTAGLLHFSFWLVSATLVSSLTEVTYGAWSTEITDDYHQRSRLATSQAWGGATGLEAFSAVPLLWFLRSGRIDFESLRVVGLLIAVFAPFSMLACARLVPVGRSLDIAAMPSWRETLRSIAGNGPLQRVLVAVGLWEFAIGASSAAMFMYVDSYLRAGQAIPYQGLVSFPALLVGMTLTSLAIRRQQKHHVWAVSMAMVGAVMCLQVFLRPEFPQLVAALLAAQVAIYLMMGGAAVVPQSVIGDIVDYEAMRSGRQVAGQFVATLQLSQKLLSGLAASGGLYLLSLFDFKPGQPAYGPLDTFGVTFVAAGLPALLMFACAVIVWRYPITQQRHRAILRRLARRRPAPGVAD